MLQAAKKGVEWLLARNATEGGLFQSDLVEEARGIARLTELALSDVRRPALAHLPARPPAPAASPPP